MMLACTLPHAGPLATAPILLSLARQTEAMGFQRARVGEHLIYPRYQATKYPYTSSGARVLDVRSNSLEQFTLFAWLAGQTSTMRFQTGVTLLCLRELFATSRAISTLDFLSGGRLEVEVGVGWNTDEFDIMGVPFEDRGSILDDRLGAMMALFSGGKGYQGPHHQFPDVNFHPTPLQDPFPIWVGSGANRRAFARIARFARGWTPIGLTMEKWPTALAQLHEELARANRAPEDLALQASAGLTAEDPSHKEDFLHMVAGYHELGVGSINVDVGIYSLTAVEQAINLLGTARDLVRREFGESVAAT